MSTNKRKKILKKISFEETEKLKFPTIEIDKLKTKPTTESNVPLAPSEKLEPTATTEVIPEETKYEVGEVSEEESLKIFNEIFLQAAEDVIYEGIRSNTLDSEIALEGLEKLKQILQVNQQSGSQELLAAASKK